VTAALEPVPDLAFARAALQAYVPRDAGQERFRAHLMGWIDAHPADAHQRSCLAGHLTASVLLLDHRRERLLLHHHAKLDRWLQFGGHCDGDANFRHVAWRELLEESGIEPAWMGGEPVDLDVHPIPARPGEPAHDHLDVRYVAVAPPGARAVLSDESKELRWFRRDELAALGLDASLRRLVRVGWTPAE
jgi:ADP-ribose pyrophosphatase YjhB (NUDIX family)